MFTTKTRERARESAHETTEAEILRELLRHRRFRTALLFASTFDSAVDEQIPAGTHRALAAALERRRTR